MEFLFTDRHTGRAGLGVIRNFQVEWPAVINRFGSSIKKSKLNILKIKKGYKWNNNQLTQKEHLARSNTTLKELKRVTRFGKSQITLTSQKTKKYRIFCSLCAKITQKIIPKQILHWKGRKIPLTSKEEEVLLYENHIQCTPFFNQHRK